MVSVKICGLKTPETLDAAIAGGASHVGFVFYAPSPRNVSIEQAAALSARTGDRAKTVGLFVDADPEFIESVRRQVRLDILQLHGVEHPALVGRLRTQHGLEVWKAVPVKTADDVRSARKFLGSASQILFDAKAPTGAKLPGGNGLRFDWELLKAWDRSMPWVLSGGLDRGNVADAVARTGATLLDVSSGVETAPGVKDVDKIAAFLSAATKL